MMRLPWRGRSVPHATLDILRGCNCRCRDCYNADVKLVAKPLERVKNEFLMLRKLRNLTTVTLSGGDPLLHPEICEIVRFLAEEGKVTPCTLSNGIAFTDESADRLHAAGLRLIALHIQEGQVRPDIEGRTFDELRREKGRIARAHGIFPATVATIAAADAAGFAALAEFFRSAPEYDYALVTVAQKFGELRSDRAQDDVCVGPMLAAMRAKGFVPAAFVGGRIDRAKPRWYIFQSSQALDAQGRERAWNEVRPGLLERLALGIAARVFHRSFYWVRSTSARQKLHLLLNGLTGGRLSTFVFALNAIVRGWTLKEKHVIVQLPPHSLGDGRIEFCDGCPDATIRNGHLNPLCLGDIPEEVLV